MSVVCKHLVAALAFAMVVPSAGAAEYPSKPIRFIVPQPPGGAADIVARLLAPGLNASLGQQVVIDNRSGAGGLVGTDLAAKSSPDGYTLLLGYTGSLTINPSLYKKLPYRPQDFDPISLATASPFLLVVHPSVRAATVSELIAFAKGRPVPLNYASPGNGSLHHLAMEWFKSLTGANVVHVPYKGAQSFTAVIAGEVSLMFASVIGMMPHAKAGRVKVLAITSRNRSRLLPDLPTVAESGAPGFEASNWFGVLAPRGTPRAIILKLSALVASHVKSAELKERLLNSGAEPIGSTPEEFQKLINAEIPRWAEVIKTSGARVD